MNKISPFFIILAAVLWGIDGVILTPALYGLPVDLVVLIESAIVAVLISPIFFKYYYEIKALSTKDWIAFAGVGLFGGAIGTMAITKALFYVDFVNLSVVVLIQKLQPIFAIVLSAIILKEKADKRFYIWAFVAIIGAYFLTFGLKSPVVEESHKTLYAVLYAVLAAFGFAMSTVLSKRALKNITFIPATYLRFFIATVILLFIVGLSGNYSGVANITPTQVFVFIVIAFSTGGFAIFLYYYGLKRVSASVASICELAFPLTAVILEYFLRDNLLDAFQWIGAIILLFSIYKVSTYRT